MLVNDYLEESVISFCKLNKIPIVNGRVSDEHEICIKKFIDKKLEKDRKRTRALEDYHNFKIEKIINDIVGKFKSLCESPIEDYLYRAMEKHDLIKYCEQQFKIGTKRVDFAFPLAKLVIECDGKEYHHTENYQIERDLARDKYLARKGWRVLHIEGLAIRRNIDLCIEKIYKSIKPYLTEGKHQPKRGG